MNALEQLREDQRLGSAWRRCEAALPEGGHFSLDCPETGSRRQTIKPNYHVAAYCGERTVTGEADIEPYGAHVTVNGEAAIFAVWIGAGNGPTPTAALEALAEALEARRAAE